MEHVGWLFIHCAKKYCKILFLNKVSDLNSLCSSEIVMKAMVHSGRGGLTPAVAKKISDNTVTASFLVSSVSVSNM